MDSFTQDGVISVRDRYLGTVEFFATLFQRTESLPVGNPKLFRYALPLETSNRKCVNGLWERY